MISRRVYWRAAIPVVNCPMLVTLTASCCISREYTSPIGVDAVFGREAEAPQMTYREVHFRDASLRRIRAR